MFGYSKLDVMFGRETPEARALYYRTSSSRGRRSARRRSRRSTRSPAGHDRRGTYDADILVVALGADIDPELTPGLVEDGNEFYSVAGAERLRDVLPTFAPAT